MGKSVELKRFRIQTKATAFSLGVPKASRRITLMENIVFLRSEENELSTVRVRDRITRKSTNAYSFIYIYNVRHAHRRVKYSRNGVYVTCYDDVVESERPVQMTRSG